MIILFLQYLLKTTAINLVKTMADISVYAPDKRPGERNVIFLNEALTI